MQNSLFFNVTCCFDLRAYKILINCRLLGCLPWAQCHSLTSIRICFVIMAFIFPWPYSSMLLLLICSRTYNVSFLGGSILLFLFVVMPLNPSTVSGTYVKNKWMNEWMMDYTSILLSEIHFIQGFVQSPETVLKPSTHVFKGLLCGGNKQMGLCPLLSSQPGWEGKYYTST